MDRDQEQNQSNDRSGDFFVFNVKLEDRRTVRAEWYSTISLPGILQNKC